MWLLNRIALQHYMNNLRLSNAFSRVYIVMRESSRESANNQEITNQAAIQSESGRENARECAYYRQWNVLEKNILSWEETETSERIIEMNLHLKYERRSDEPTSIKMCKVFFLRAKTLHSTFSPPRNARINLNKVFSKLINSIWSSWIQPLEH